MDRGTWWTAVHGATKSQTQLSSRGCTHVRMESSRVRKSQKSCFAMWLAASGFMVIGSFLGCDWPVILIQDLCRLCAHHSAKMGSSKKDPGRLVGYEDWSLLLTFLNSSRWWQLVSSVFLPRTSCLRGLTEVVIMVPHRGGSFSQWFPSSLNGETTKTNETIFPLLWIVQTFCSD